MTGLDAKLKKRLRRELGALLEELDITTLYVTHDQEEAMVMADRIAVLNDGNLEQVNEPHELYERPANEFVATFVGTSNLLAASIVDGTVDLGFIDLETGAVPNGTGDVTPVVGPDDFSVGDGPIEATITDLYYMGDDVQATAELPDGREVTLALDDRARGVEQDGAGTRTRLPASPR